jgi:microcompartment protein CcmL/EutN
MALPIVDNQSTDATQQAIDSLGQIIKEKVNASISGGVKTIIPNIPKMINELTVDLKKGPVNSFTRVIVKLERLVEKLGLDLREYSTELADLLIQRETKARESEETVTKLREQNIVARVNKETKEVEVLTRSQIRQEEKIFKLKEKNITKIETELDRDRKKLQVGDSLSNKEKKTTKDRIVANTKELDKLKKR